jgi:hypothetical protein
VAKNLEGFGKFVRLHLTGESVEVVSFDSNEITVKYKGKDLVMSHHEVSLLTPEEQAAAKRISG